ncbi:MAG: hypothetical protein GY953_27405 [bacterium]|nr:hypothetical protein [bacterium]
MLKHLVFVAMAAAVAFGQQQVTFEDRPGIAIGNDKLVLTVLPDGASMARLVLKEDAARINPMWNPSKHARKQGRPPRTRGGTGHFVCVDGFGPVSPEERAAGLNGHGEANDQQFEVVESSDSTLTLRAELPIVREVLTRAHRMLAGENVVYVESELENLLGFDRPVVWAEHATIGDPFLAPVVTKIDMSAGRSQTRPYVDSQRPRRLASGVDFTWPMAPTTDGKLVSVRAAPANPNLLDHTTSLMDPNREIQFVTALNTENRLLLGYLFRREEYPWLQIWENYPQGKTLARGLEFSSQPYDVPRRESISLGKMFDAPTFRWLPAKGKLTSKFLMFYIRVPKGFAKVDDAWIEDGTIILEDRRAGKRIALKASRGL